MLINYQSKFGLRHLRSFMVIADQLSFRKAASLLHIAQPALSRQISQLESSLECELFDRQKRQIQLTEAGAFLYKKTPALFDQLQNILEQTHNVGSGRISSLRFGYSGAAMSSFLPAVIREIRNTLDQCEFHFFEKTSDQLILDVLHEKIDAAFILYHPENPLLNLIPIRSERMGIILPDGHPLTSKKEVSLKELKNETLILFPRKMNPIMYDEIIAHCHRAGFSPREIRETAPRSTAIGLVAAGEGVATIAESYAHTCVRGTVYRPLKQPGPMIQFCCITHAERDGEWLNILKNIIQRDLS